MARSSAALPRRNSSNARSTAARSGARSRPAPRAPALPCSAVSSRVRLMLGTPASLDRGAVRPSSLGRMAPRRPSTRLAAPPTVRELLAGGAVSYSFEFFPPKSDEGERQLWRTIRELEGLSPTFVSVTYGAGGSNRDRTVRITGRIAAETTLNPVAHLTCVGHSRAELRSVIGAY